MSPLPEALLFDLDGVLVDSLPSIARCWSATLADFGRLAPDPAGFRPMLGPPADAVARRLAPDASEETVAEIVAAYRRRSVAATDVDAFPGVPEMLAELGDRGVQLSVATSKSVEVAEPLLGRLGLRHRFAAIEGTPVDELGADKATVVARVLERLAPVRPAALIGDRKHDIGAAITHGLHAVGVLWGYGDRAELEAAGAEVLVASPGDVLAVAERLG